MTGDVRRELRAFYEAEARRESRGAPSGRRVDALADFVSMVSGVGTSVIDVGAGPGTDAAAFTVAGVRYTGVDLAPGNAALAQRRGHRVMAASLFGLPFRDDSFDIGWSMSTFMHVPEREVPVALREFSRVLRPGALVGVGQWGGELGDILSGAGVDADVGPRRLFSLRTAEINRALVETVGAIERFEVWDVGPPGWEYHFAVLRLS